ncbi:hypothetical protein WJU23_02095 [Prosthecobacter sp. SYSU 5D2]|uniref:hypothetical protein n=1 Tax=Prosthecobacter sp. SYSU 5D2 TaxID=3134134 RepID=UPI0031FE7E34
MNLVLANVVMFGAWPYIVSFWLSPLIFGVESWVVWGRHRQGVGFGQAFGTVFVANLVSALIGLMLAGWGVWGLQNLSDWGFDLVLVIWSWAMSCMIEYAVLRLMLPKVGIRGIAMTCLWMNTVTYVLIFVALRTLV